MTKMIKKNQGFSAVDVLLGVAAFGVFGMFVALESVFTILFCTILK